MDYIKGLIIHPCKTNVDQRKVEKNVLDINPISKVLNGP